MPHSIDIGAFKVWSLPDGAANLPTWAMHPDLDGGDPVQWAHYAERSPGGFHGASGNGWSSSSDGTVRRSSSVSAAAAS